jgi:hypothetical protein
VLLRGPGSPGPLYYLAIKGRLTYSNVVSSLCLFLLLGGGTAVALKGRNSVFSNDIKNRQVKGPDLATGAVSPSKLKLVRSDSVVAQEMTTQTSPSDLATPGPSVTVHVPKPGGLAAVYAVVTGQVDPTTHHGNVFLLDSGPADPLDVPDLSIGAQILQFTSSSIARKVTVPGSVLGSTSNGGWIVVHLLPGKHVLSLKYDVGAPGDTAYFVARRLSVALLR